MPTTTASSSSSSSKNRLFETRTIGYFQLFNIQVVVIVLIAGLQCSMLLQFGSLHRAISRANRVATATNNHKNGGNALSGSFLQHNDNHKGWNDVDINARSKGSMESNNNDSNKNIHNNATHHSCRLQGESILPIPKAPHFMIVGAQKAGTSAISKFLEGHPAFHRSDAFEPHFFDWFNPADWPMDFRASIPADILKEYPAFSQSQNDVQYIRDDANDNNSKEEEEERMCRARQANAQFYGQYSKKLAATQSDQSTSKRSLIAYEKTPSYLSSPLAPAIIKTVCAPWKPKFLIVLRNPVERAYSYYKMEREAYRVQNNITSFEELARRHLRHFNLFGFTNVPPPPNATHPTDYEAIPVAERSFTPPVHNDTAMMGYLMDRHVNIVRSPFFVSMYVYHIRRWLQYFQLATSASNDGDVAPPFSIKVVRYEDFKENKLERMEEILSFVLGSDASPDDLKYFSLSNQTERLEHNLSPNSVVQQERPETYHAPMPDYLEKYLYHLYEPYNNQLADLLGEEWRDVWKYPGEKKNVAEK